MNRIVTVVGARPQFIKAAVVSHELQKWYREIIVHTGQHYDYNMSELFFEELDIPRPNYNLGISGGTHGQMTGKMLIEIESVLIKEKPDMLIVYGDTNSTLAAAIAAAKLHIPICHVEAGNRTHCRNNPEEINRICTDQLSSLLMVATLSGMKELKHEGLLDRAYLVGDPMFDAFKKYCGKLHRDDIRLKGFNGESYKAPEQYYYLTCHREENTNDEAMLQLFLAMKELDALVIYPVHPRNKERASRILATINTSNIILVEPVGYLESICLVNNAKKIITDSGGLQREAFFAGKQCVTILDFEVWPETMIDNRNQLARPLVNDIIKKLETEQRIDWNYNPFGDGQAAVKIVEIVRRFSKGYEVS